MRLTDDQLDELEALAASSIPLPWTSQVEGRDFPEGGDSLIRTGEERAWGPDIYVTAGDHGTNAILLDLIAAMRTLLPDMIDEIRDHRASVGK